MKINVNQILPEGLTLEESVNPRALALEADLTELRDPINLKASITRITNAVTADVVLNYTVDITCSRCLCEFKQGYTKNIRLNYVVNKFDPVIDFDPDIREEIILDLPFKPLCRPDCRGLCLKCGVNLNSGKCSCVK